MKKASKIITKTLFTIFLIAATVTVIHVSSECYFVSLVPHPKDVEELDLSRQHLFSTDEIYQFKNLRSIDLRGKVLDYSEIEKLRRAYPGITVRWDIKLGDGYCDSESTDLTVKKIEKDDLRNLSLFPNLKTLTIIDTPYDQELETEIGKISDIDIVWSFKAGSKQFSGDSESIDLSGTEIDVQTLPGELEQFKKLKKVNVSGTSLSAEELRDLSEKCGDVLFVTKISYNGTEIDTSETSLNAKKMDADTLEYALTVSKALEKVDVENGVLKEPEIKKIADKFTKPLFIWTTTLAGREYSTAAEEIDLSKVKIDDFETFKKDVSYFRALKKADLCGSSLNNSQMEELCTAYPGTKFVWIVKMNAWNIRTDATAFSTAYRRVRGFEGDGISKKDMEVFKYCTDLEALDMGHMGITNIDNIACLKKLKILILADNKITDISPIKDFENLVYVELFMNGISDLSPLLASKDNLLDLNICWNSVRDTDVICQLSKLERLWMCGNGIAYNNKSLKAIKTALPKCEVNSTQTFSTGDGWRKHRRYFWMRDQFGLFYMD